MIRAKEVRVVGSDGKQLGNFPLYTAVKMTEEAGLDLVEVAPNTNPPVCKIMDYNKYKYDLAKKERMAKKKQHVVHMKEIKMSSKIEEHDYQTKLSHLKKFLERGDKTKITMYFRGREMTHVDLGRKIFDRLISDLTDFGVIDQMPKLEGKLMIMIVRSK